MNRSILVDPELLEDPAPYYRQLRQSPLCFDEALGFYICSHYEQMRRILRDTATFSNVGSQTMDSLRPPPAEVLELRASMLTPANTLVTNDPPSHTRYRNMVDAPFRPKAVKQLQTDIREIVDQSIDQFAHQQACEFVSEFAIPLPVLVIADMLGLPRELAPQIKAWSDASVEPLGMMISDERFIECTREVKAFQDFVVAQIEKRRLPPTNDLLSHLAQVQDERGQQLTHAEIVSLTSQFLVAGNETTTNGLAAGMRMLIEQPALCQELRQQPDRMLTFVNEVLRLQAPVQGLFRVVTKDVEFDGVTPSKGARIMLRFAAANRDPEKFTDPERFDVGRDEGPAMSFASGIHYCLGANLSRAEGQEVFSSLIDRCATIELDGDLVQRNRMTLRGFSAVPVKLTAR